MIADLHCHSTASDGELRPRDLLQRAIEAGVDMLSITDHDTVAAYDELGTCETKGMRIITGVEFSARWRGRTIHIVGLNIDLESPVLENAVLKQNRARDRRATAIAGKLEQLGFDDTLQGARRMAGGARIGRPHFAQHLVATGQVTSIAAAFKKYLGSGKPGDIECFWPSLETAVAWVRAAGGTAVLAHPGKYRMTNAGITRLADDFTGHGGQAVEVLSGRQAPDLTRKLARLCNDRHLYASCGSDFHAPNRPWCELGRFGPLPGDCRPVWELF
ncbi:MAG: PHP domain-containing protein [Gammaproteobacteria bacterium]